MPSYTRVLKLEGYTADEIYEKISKDLDKLLEKDMSKFGKLNFGRDEDTKSVTLESKLVSATLLCLDGRIELDGKLSLVAIAFKSKIDEGIDRWIKKTFPNLPQS